MGGELALCGRTWCCVPLHSLSNASILEADQVLFIPCSFWFHTRSLWGAGGECAVWLMHLCIVWILAEICLCAGEPAPPKLGSLTSCWWRKVKGAAHCCSWTLWRKRWRWSWLLCLICEFGELFVPEGENGSRDFVVFSCCLSSFFWKEKTKPHQQHSAVFAVAGWGFPPALCSEYFPPSLSCCVLPA